MATYVELRRDEYFSQEVATDDVDRAVEEVLLAAPGAPGDWEIVKAEHAVHRATDDASPGAAIFDD